MPSSLLEEKALLARKVESLDDLTRVYKQAISGLAETDLEAARTQVERADPILERLLAIEETIAEKGFSHPQEVERKIDAVKGLHSQLMQVIGEEMETIREQRERLGATRQALRKYGRSRNGSPGSLIDDRA